MVRNQRELEILLWQQLSPESRDTQLNLDPVFRRPQRETYLRPVEGNYSCLLWGLSVSPCMGTEVIWEPPGAELPLLRLENFSLNLIPKPSPSHNRGMEADRQQVRGCSPTAPLLSWSMQESGQ